MPQVLQIAAVQLRRDLIHIPDAANLRELLDRMEDKVKIQKEIDEWLQLRGELKYNNIKTKMLINNIHSHLVYV